MVIFLIDREPAQQETSDKTTRLAKVRAFLASAPMPDDLKPRAINKRIVAIVWPSAVELLLTSLVSMVDMMMVGRLGAWAVAAVGLTTQPKFVILAVFMALNSGATAMVARFRGAGEPDNANAVMRQAVLLTAFLGTALAVGGFFATDWIMLFMAGGPEALGPDTLRPAGDYLRIQMIGFPFMALTFAATAALRGVGNTRASMIYNMAANVINCVLNYILIYGNFGAPAMGVAGASLATIIGQFAAFLMAAFTLLSGKYYIRIRRGDSFRPDFGLMKRIAKIGIPAMFEQAVMRTGMLLYVRTVTGLGAVAFATHNIVMNIMNLSFMNGQAFGIVATTLIGQSLGNKRPDHAKIYARYTRRMGMFVSLVIGVVFFFLGGQIVGLYTAGDAEAAEIIRIGGQVMMIIALLQPLQSSQLVLNGALRGAGDTRSTAMIMFLCVLIIRPIAAHIFVNWLHWGLLGAWGAMALDQVIRSALSFLRFQMGKWIYIRV